MIEIIKNEITNIKPNPPIIIGEHLMCGKRIDLLITIRRWSGVPRNWLRENGINEIDVRKICRTSLD